MNANVPEQKESQRSDGSTADIVVYIRYLTDQ